MKIIDAKGPTTNLRGFCENPFKRGELLKGSSRKSTSGGPVLKKRLGVILRQVLSTRAKPKPLVVQPQMFFFDDRHRTLLHPPTVAAPQSAAPIGSGYPIIVRKVGGLSPKVGGISPGLFYHHAPLYNKTIPGENKIRAPPSFRGVKGLRAIMYYDLLIEHKGQQPGPRHRRRERERGSIHDSVPVDKKKRILFLTEHHEYPNDFGNISRYISNLRDFVKKQPDPDKHCVDVHCELMGQWNPIKTPNYIGRGHAPAGSRVSSNLNKLSELISTNGVNYFGPGVRIHMDDLRGHHRHGERGVRLANYSHPRFRLSANEVLAVAFGIGPLCDGDGNINDESEYILEAMWSTVPHNPDDGGVDAFLPWNRMSIIRSRARKTMHLFMDEYNVTIGNLYPVMRDVIKMSERGLSTTIGSFGWEGINDIYSFFRMFRTFSNKRSIPCADGYQHNIIYISHVSHSLKIMYMMKRIFGIRHPSYSEAIDDVVNMPGAKGGVIKAWEQATDSPTAVTQWVSKVAPLLTFDKNIEVVPLGKAARTPSFFA